jgi:hypothetical protein
LNKKLNKNEHNPNEKENENPGNHFGFKVLEKIQTQGRFLKETGNRLFSREQIKKAPCS